MNVATGMLCLALMTCQDAVYGKEPESSANTDVKDTGMRVQPRDVPGFRKLISGEFRNPKPQDLVDLVRRKTGQRISLDASVVQDRPLQGQTCANQVPAYFILESLAQNQYIKGYWIKRGEEYVLIATYSGKPPPLPPQIPPHLRKAMEEAAKNPPPPPSPEPEPYANLTQRRIWWAVSWLALAVLFVRLFLWPRKTAPSTTTTTPLSKGT